MLKYKILFILVFCILLASSKNYPPAVEILPVQCFNNPYLDKLLDAIRIEESCNGKYILSINRNKKGKELSRDEGDYQHNNKNWLVFANLYNDGKRYNPYDPEKARRISRQYIVDNYKISGNYFDALVMYNCGLPHWLKGAQYKSFQYAERILKKGG